MTYFKTAAFSALFFEFICVFLVYGEKFGTFISNVKLPVLFEIVATLGTAHYFDQKSKHYRYFQTAVLKPLVIFLSGIVIGSLTFSAIIYFQEENTPGFTRNLIDNALGAIGTQLMVGVLPCLFLGNIFWLIRRKMKASTSI